MLVSAVMSIVSASRRATKRSQILCFVDHESWYTRVGTLIVATIYLQLIQN